MKCLEKLMLCFPRSVTLAFGRYMGKLGYYLFKKRRLLGLHNLNHALGSQYNDIQQKIIIQQLFEHLGMNFIEFLRLSEITSDNFSQYITFHGKEYLDQAYDQKKGVLVLTAHIGNWELLAAAVGLSGFNTAMVVKSARQKSVDNYLIQSRQNKNIQLFFGKNSIKAILKQLNSGGIVGIVLDQHATSSEGVVVPFFGRHASTFKSLGVLSQRTQAIILPMYIYRDKNCHHHIIIHPPIKHDINETIETRTQKYTRWIESAIQAHPEQWIWTHNRWKILSA
jgi:KDO2-lipid IV(A) lauroyltransferase